MTGLPVVLSIFQWWAAEVIGIAVVAPFAVTLFNLRGADLCNLNVQRVVEYVASLAGIAFAVQCMFGVLDQPVSYLAVPVLLWIAFRFEVIGTTFAVFAFAIPTVWYTINGGGPFVVDDNTTATVVRLQGYLSLTSITFLLIATVLRERHRIVAIIQDSEQCFRDLFENVTDMIHSVGPDGVIQYANRARGA